MMMFFAVFLQKISFVIFLQNHKYLCYTIKFTTFIIMNWKRYRLKTYAVNDNRPLIFNPNFPWWCSGYGEDEKGEYSIIITYLPKDENLLEYWDDAFDVEFTEEENISFTSRFPKPTYFVY